VSTKTILVVSFTEIGNDVRILRHIEALSVNYSIISIGYGAAPRVSKKHYQIPDTCGYLPLNPVGIASLLLRQFKKAITRTPAITFVEKILEGLEFDAILLNDVQTLPLLNNPLSKHKIIVDMHEFAPREMEDDWRFRLLLQRHYTWLCNRYLGLANLVLTVSPGLKDGYDELCGTSAFVIRNICKFEDISLKENIGPIRLVHSGLAVRGRKLEAMIHAAADIENIELDMYLVEAPRQKRYLALLNKTASRTNNVSIKTPVKQDQIVRNLNQYDVGLLLIAASNFSLKHGLPNKLFDYLQARIMTIAGPSPDMAEVVLENHLGHVLSTYGAEELRSYLINLDRSVILNFKKNAARTAHIVNQETEMEKLMNIVRNLV
jgi:hypothetical protein